MRAHPRPDFRPGDRGRRGLRLAFVMPGLLLGGTETVVRHLCRHLPTRWSIDVLSYTIDDRATGDLMSHIDLLAIAGTPEQWPGDLTDNEELAQWLADVYRRRRYEVVVAINTRVALEVARAVLPEAALVDYAHGVWYWHPVDKPCDVVVAVSQCVADAVRRARPGVAVRVVRNGIDVHRFDPATVGNPEAARRIARERLGLPAHSRIVGYVGRVSEEKGIDVLVEAAAGAEWHLLIVGPAYGPGYGARITAAVEGMPNIHWLRSGLPPADISLAYWAADAIAIPSRAEGFCLAAIEALASGRPLIASDVGGLREAADRWATWVPPDDVAALRGAIERVLAGDHPDREAAREWVRRHRSAEAMARRFASVVRNLVAKRRAGDASSNAPGTDAADQEPRARNR